MGILKSVVPSRSGSVMILSLWVLAVLVCLAAGLSYRSRLNLRLTQYAWDEIRLLQAAKKAVRENVFAWSKNSVVKNKRSSFEDENSRINLNKASPEILRRLFDSNAGVVPVVLDWRSPAGTIAGYETFGYAARHAPFKSVNELRLVQGVTPEIFLDVGRFLTVDTGGDVNVNTASSRVLEAIGLPASLANKILWLRAGADGLEGTDDDVVFDSIGSLASILGSKTSMSDVELKSLQAAIRAGLLSAQSSGLRMLILARLDDNRALRRVSVVASGHGGGTRLLQWEEEP